MFIVCNNTIFTKNDISLVKFIFLLDPTVIKSSHKGCFPSEKTLFSFPLHN